jgi:hypothetical protein
MGSGWEGTPQVAPGPHSADVAHICRGPKFKTGGHGPIWQIVDPMGAIGGPSPQQTWPGRQSAADLHGKQDGPDRHDGPMTATASSALPTAESSLDSPAGPTTGPTTGPLKPHDAAAQSTAAQIAAAPHGQVSPLRRVRIPIQCPRVAAAVLVVRRSGVLRRCVPRGGVLG